MSNISNRKRPPKLNFSVQETQQQPVSLVHEPEQTQNVDAKSTRTVPIAADHKGATSATACDSCNLESTVRVQVGDREDILISPDSLLVCEQLGRGQYGIVEKVNHQESGCYFAVKRVALRPGDTSEQTRLLMDVDILVKGTECKNIIKFFGALLWEGDLWILMELMDCSLHRFYRLAHKKVDTPLTLMADLNSKRNLKGSSLVIPCAHVTEKVQLGNCDLCNPIPERVLGRIAADIVNALSYLYSIKVIHRDIKPSNILINRVGVIKLCDFGISGYLVNSVARTYEAGCRPYMAPERIDPPRDRTGYDIKSDVWSFGITMLEIATGRYPYHNARDFFEQLKAICADEPPRLTKGRFTAVFENFVAECLHKNYQLRPKYEIIETHKFIRDHKDLDIREFTERILTSELGKVSANS